MGHILSERVAQRRQVTNSAASVVLHSSEFCVDPITRSMTMSRKDLVRNREQEPGFGN